MSRAKPAAERVALDAYQTPAALAEAACATLARLIDEPSSIVEPSAGLGAFVRAARACWPHVEIDAVDVDPACGAACVEAGASSFTNWRWEDWQANVKPSAGGVLVLGNPPFREAVAHVEAALGWMAEGDHLAFLLRLNLLGSATRVGFWKRAPLWAVLPVIPRPSFVGGGTDATEYAVMVWRKGFAGAPRILPPIVWREKGRRAP